MVEQAFQGIGGNVQALGNRDECSPQIMNAECDARALKDRSLGPSDVLRTVREDKRLVLALWPP
jgi:hypothetical protein